MKHYHVQLVAYIRDNMLSVEKQITFGKVVKAESEAMALVEALNSILPVETEDYWPEEINLFHVDLVSIREVNGEIPF